VHRCFIVDGRLTNVTVSDPEGHTHSCDTFHITRDEIVSKMITKISEDPSIPIRRVYDDILDHNESDSDNPTFQ
jgi:hypothetical protein